MALKLLYENNSYFKKYLFYSVPKVMYENIYGLSFLWKAKEKHGIGPLISDEMFMLQIIF